MIWDCWLMVERGADDDLAEFTPVELNAVGGIENVVIGMCIMSTLAEMKKRAKEIWRVDDLETLKNAKQVWP